MGNRMCVFIMAVKPQDPDDQRKALKRAGVYIMIPFILAVSPIVGWLLGSSLDKMVGTHPYLMYAGILLGFLAGFRELYRMIKRFGNGE